MDMTTQSDGGAVYAAALAAALVCAVPVGAQAQTEPIAGAVAKPVDMELSLPFVAGEQVEILAGYGPNAGSSLHRDTNKTTKANEHYALDLILPQHPNSGLGQPVLAMASGTVVKAGWGTQGWTNYGQRVIVRVEHAGQSYHMLYAHLNAIDVAEGDIVQRGQPLGELGGSCQGALSCSSFSTPHLHMSIHLGSQVGGSGTGGSYGGNAVVPEAIDGYTNLTRGEVLVSQNTGPDGEPFRVCPVPESGEMIVEETDTSCFRRVTDYWWDGQGGHGGGHIYTLAITSAQPDTQAWWSFTPRTSGDYELAAHIPAGAESQQATYRIQVGGQELGAVTIDQTAQTGWVSLGTFELEADQLVQVQLGDNTGEPYHGVDDPRSRKLAYDAMRIGPPSPDDPEDPPVEEPPVEEPPVEDPPAEDPPIQDPPDEDPPVEQPPTEDPDPGDPGEPEDPAEPSPAGDPDGGAMPGEEAEGRQGNSTVTTGSACATGAPGAPAAPGPGWLVLLPALGWVSRRALTRRGRA